VILSLLLVDSLFSTLHFFKAFPMLYVYKHEYTKMERLTPLSHYLSVYILVFLPVPQSVRSILSVFPSPSISPMSKVSFIGLFSNVISNLREFVGLFYRSLQRVSFFMYFSGMIVMFAGRICICALTGTCAEVLLIPQCLLRMLHPRNPRHPPDQAHSDSSVSRGTN